MSHPIDVGSVLGGRYKVTATVLTSHDQDLVLDGVDQVLNRPVPTADRLRLRGLDATRRYRVSGWPDVADALFRDNVGEWGGDELMQVGLSLTAERHEAGRWGDFRAWLFVLEAV